MIKHIIILYKLFVFFLQIRKKIKLYNVLLISLKKLLEYRFCSKINQLSKYLDISQTTNIFFVFHIITGI